MDEVMALVASWNIGAFVNALDEVAKQTPEVAQSQEVFKAAIALRELLDCVSPVTGTPAIDYTAEQQNWLVRTWGDQHGC